MTAEYSVEEVRARLAKLHDFINGKCANDEAGWKCVGFIFQHGEQLLNILAERIKADEVAVPVATLHADGFWTWKGTPPHESNHAGWRMDVFARPPAQAAQETPCSLNEALAVIEAWADRGNRLDGDDATRLRAIADRIAPTAEPVAQGEAVGFITDEGVGGAFARFTEEGHKLPAGTKLYAAQPRAVPAERVVEDSALIPRHYASNIGHAACMMESSQSVLDRREAPILRKIAALLAAAPSPGESE